MTAKNYIRIFLIPLMVMISLIIGCGGGGGGGDDGTSNKPPTADAGQDQTVTEGAMVTLNGSGSDSDGTVSSYSWSQTDDTGITCTLSDPSATQPTFTAPDVEETTTVIFSLTVKDNSGESSSPDSVTIIINPNENEPPTADAGEDQTVTEGTTVTLNGSGSDSDGTILSYLWSQTDDTGITCTLSDPTAAQPTFKAPDVEEATIVIFSLTVKDNSGASSSSDTVKITIKPLFAFASACNADFNGISEASAFDEKVGIHPIVLLSNGKRHEFNDDFPADWVPDSVNDTVLIACMGNVGTKLIQTCRYTDKPNQFPYPSSVYTLKRYKRSIDMKILAANTGYLIGTEKVYGSSPDSCPETIYTNTDISKYGQHVTSEDIEKALSKYVNGLIVKGFDSPGISPKGLAFDGTYLWCLDYTDRKIYKLDTNGNIIDSFGSPGVFPYGLAFDGIYLWVGVEDYSGNDKYSIYKLDTDGNIIDSFGLGSIEPNELAFDGAYIWCVDANHNDKIYKLDTNGNQIDSFDAPSKLSFGLAFDGTYLWTTSYGTKIYKLDTNGNVIDSFDAPENTVCIRGLAFDGTYLWCSDTDDKIYKLPKIPD